MQCRRYIGASDLLVSHCGCNTSHAGVGDPGRVYCAALGAASTDERLVALTDADITFTKSGFWARNGPVFIHVRKIHPGGIPVDIDIFEWDQEGRLRVFTHARKADVTENNRWVLTDVEQRIITAQGVTTRRLPRLTLESFLSAEQMTIQEFPPEIQSPSDLYQYIRLLRERGQNPDQYELLFWQKVSTPLSTAALVLLSLTFVFATDPSAYRWIQDTDRVNRRDCAVFSQPDSWEPRTRFGFKPGAHRDGTCCSNPLSRSLALVARPIAQY